jgi:hypothetical protein
LASKKLTIPTVFHFQIEQIQPNAERLKCEIIFARALYGPTQNKGLVFPRQPDRSHNPVVPETGRYPVVGCRKLHAEPRAFGHGVDQHLALCVLDLDIHGGEVGAGSRIENQLQVTIPRHIRHLLTFGDAHTSGIIDRTIGHALVLTVKGWNKFTARGGHACTGQKKKACHRTEEQLFHFDTSFWIDMAYINDVEKAAV